LQLLSGLWLGLAAWVAGSLLQAWVPIWQMLLIGIALVAGTAVLRARFAVELHAVADFSVVAAMWPLSVIPVDAPQVIAAAIAFAATGFVIDRLTGRLRPRLRPILLALPAALALVVGWQVRQPGNFGSRLLALDPLFPLRLVLTAPSAGAYIPLGQNTAAWLLRNPGSHPRGMAIVLHGNHRLGSRQPSSIALHGALMRAGYDVLAVDHPGFGASLAPYATAEWPAWDPTIGPRRALSYISGTHLSRAPETIVVGHSMGVDVALKWVADGALVQQAYLFGGSLDRPNGPNWLRGFHRERQIPCCVPEPTMQMIRNEYYGGGDRFATALPTNHAPVHYVRFGIEHADVTRDSEPLYAAITSPKRPCDLANVSHYFNTLAVRGFALLDANTIALVADVFGSGERANAACRSK